MTTTVAQVEAVWLFLLRITETAPIGVWSFLIAAILPACFAPWLRRGLPPTWHSKSRDFIVETAALVAGIALAWLPWQTLPGLLVGIMGGFMSPYLTLGWQAITGLIGRVVRRRLGVPDPTTPHRRADDPKPPLAGPEGPLP
jgi:hypothetical protein